jgi:hypothetical protein
MYWFLFVVSTLGDATNFPSPKGINWVPRRLKCDLIFTFLLSTLVFRPFLNCFRKFPLSSHNLKGPVILDCRTRRGT